MSGAGPDRLSYTREGPRPNGRVARTFNRQAAWRIGGCLRSRQRKWRIRTRSDQVRAADDDCDGDNWFGVKSGAGSTKRHLDQIWRVSQDSSVIHL